MNIESRMLFSVRITCDALGLADNTAYYENFTKPVYNYGQISENLNVKGGGTYRFHSALTFFGAFAKLRKATISFIMSCLSVPLFLRLSVRPRGTTRLPLGGFFYEIFYLGMFRKSVEKSQFSLKSDKNNGYFTWRRMYICDNISLNYS